MFKVSKKYLKCAKKQQEKPWSHFVELRTLKYVTDKIISLNKVNFKQKAAN
jgi:hypothetical protein